MRGKGTMAELSTDLLEIVLRDVAAAGAEPWYPATYAQVTGVPRDRLEASLDRLRLAGLVRLTDWVQGRGQGYTLTPEGQQVLDHPRLLDRLRDGRELPRSAPAQPAEPRSLRQPGTTWDRGEAIRAALLDQSPPAVTRGLIWANVAVFAVGLWLATRNNAFNEYLGFSGGDQVVNAIRHETGGLYPGDLERGQWWRLVSYAFVHGGILHLAMNMYVLYVIGSLVEKMWGPVRYLILYLIAAVGGAAVHMYFEQRVGMVGASGSICGLLGSMAAWVMLNRAYLPPQLVSSWMRSLMLNALLIAFISMVPGVSWGGHLGGALAGAVVSVPLNYTRFGNGLERLLGWVGVAAVPAVCVALVMRPVSGNAANVQVPANDPEVRILRKDYGEIIHNINGIVENTYQDHGKQFLEDGHSPRKNPEATRAAIKAFDKAHAQLKKYAALLERAVPFDNRAVGVFMRQVKEYTLASAAFYRAFAQALQHPDEWREAQREALEERWQSLLGFWVRLRTSTVYDLLTGLRKE